MPPNERLPFEPPLPSVRVPLRQEKFPLCAAGVTTEKFWLSSVPEIFTRTFWSAAEELMKNTVDSATPPLLDSPAVTFVTTTGPMIMSLLFVRTVSFSLKFVPRNVTATLIPGAAWSG